MRKKKFYKITILLFISFILIQGCQDSKKIFSDKKIQEKKELIIYNESILDELKPLENYNLSSNYQKIISKYYIDDFFKEWHEPNIEKSLKIVKYYVEKFSNKDLYDESKLLKNKDFIKTIEDNIKLEKFPAMYLKGINLRSTSIRLLPYEKPVFYNFSSPGEGYPFDNFQSCNLWPATPLIILHQTQDKKWFYIKSSVSEGWVLSKDIAFVNEKFIKKWENGNYARVISENISIVDNDGNFRYNARIGTVFPFLNSEEKKTNLETKEKEYKNILVVAEDKNKNAIIKIGKVLNKNISEKPLDMNYENASSLIRKLDDQNYGWGGLYGNRDCSGLVKDYFTSFGFMIPKYSLDQANEGNYMDISELDRKNKKDFIIKNGIPFFSLLYMRGHIMIYLGHKDNDIIIFHSIWGLKTTSKTGEIGRKIIGKSIISSLELDKNILEIHSKLIDSIIGVTTFTPAIYIEKMFSPLDEVNKNSQKDQK